MIRVICVHSSNEHEWWRWRAIGDRSPAQLQWTRPLAPAYLLRATPVLPGVTGQSVTAAFGVEAPKPH